SPAPGAARDEVDVAGPVVHLPDLLVGASRSDHGGERDSCYGPKLQHRCFISTPSTSSRTRFLTSFGPIRKRKTGFHFFAARPISRSLRMNPNRDESRPWPLSAPSRSSSPT